MIHIGGILLSLSFLCLSLQSYDLSPLKNFQFLKRIPDTLNSLSQIKSLVSIDSEYNRLSYPIKKDGNDVYFIDENNNRFSLLKGADSIFSSSSSSFHYQINSKEENEGTFLSFKFDTIESQHDARLGIFPTHAKLLTHSRIKRWWMAPSFHSSASTIPVETQLLLVELDSSASDAFSKLSSSILKTNYAFPSKKYAIIAPLIDFDTGFRVTLYGSEGGPAASNNNLAIRLESGDDDIKASMIRDALYISAGNDPYQLLATAYKKIAERLGTFRTRSQKLPPLGIDSFGFCTWDAFYSSVSGESVLQGVDSLSSIGFPPRFLIIDDGWQSTSSQKSSTISMATQSAEIVTQPIVESTVETAMSTNLTGTPMTGHLASEQIAASEQSPLLRLGVRLVSQYYSKLVESGAPDSWPVKLWATLSQTVLKDKLIDFFALQTDFSKRLTSWKVKSISLFLSYLLNTNLALHL